ncbi:MAG: translocation/assembly module TamB domain-containing protein [Candidatus Xenobia bacterium]
MDAARRNYRMAGIFHSIGLAHWLNYALARQPVHVLHGRADVELGTYGSVDAQGRPTSRPDVVASGSFWDGVVSARGIAVPIEDARGRFSATADLLHLETGKARLGTARLDLEGSIFDLQQPQLDVFATVEPTDIASLLRVVGHPVRLPLFGRAEAVAAISGSMQDLMATGTVWSPSLTLDHETASSVTVPFTYGGGTVWLQHVTANIAGGRLVARGAVHPNGRQDADLWLEAWIQNLSVAQLLAQWGARPASLPALGGLASTDLFVIGSARHPLAAGMAWLRDASLQGYPFSAASRFMWQQGGVALQDGQVAISQGTVHIPQGFIDLTHQRLSVAMQGHGIALPSPLAGRVDFVGNVSGSTRNPQVQATGQAQVGGTTAWFDANATRSAGNVTLYAPSLIPADAAPGLGLPREPTDVAAFISGDPRYGYVWSGQVHGVSESLRTAGTASGDLRDVSGYVVASNAHLAALLPPALHARGSADVDALVGSHRIDYALDAHHASIRGVPLRHAEGTLAGTLQQFAVLDNFFDSPWALVAANGQVSHGFLDLALDTGNLDVPAVESGFLPAMPRVEGLAQVHGVTRGAFANPTFSGTASLPDGWIANHPFSLYSRFIASATRVQTPATTLRIGPGRVTLSGHASFQQLNLAANVQNMGVPDLLAFTPWPGIEASGTVSAALKITGPPTFPWLSGNAQIANGSLLGQDFTRFDAAFSGRTDGFALDRFMVQLPGGRIAGQGTFRQGRVDATAGGTLSLASLSAARGVSGTTDLQLHVHGRLPHGLAAEGSVTGHDVQVRGHTFSEIKVLGSLDDHHLRLAPLLISSDQGRLRVTGDVRFPHGLPLVPAVWVGNRADTPVWSVRAVLEDVDPESFLSFLKVPATGRLSGTASFLGTPHRPDLTFAVQGQDVAIDQARLGTLTFDGRYTNEQLQVNPLSFNGPSGQGDLQGVVQADGTLRGTASVQHFDLAALSHLSPLPLGGLLNLDGHLTGTRYDPNLSATFNVAHGSVSRYKFDTLQGQLEGHQGTLNVAVNSDNTVHVSGTAPFIQHGRLSQTALNLTATVNDRNLSLLSMLPDVTGTSGRLTANFTVTGTMHHPQLAGQAQIANGMVKLGVLSNPIQALQASLQLHDKTLTVQKLTAQLGGGTLQGGRSVAFGTLLDPTFDLFLRGQNLNVAAGNFFGGTANLDLKLTGPRHDPLLAGTVTLPSAKLGVPITNLAALKQPQAVALPPARVNVNVALGNNASASVLGSSVRIAGHVQVSGDTPHVYPQGILSTPGGSLSIPLIGSFRILSGRIRFDGTSWLPFVALTAENDVAGAQIFANWVGDLNNPPKQPLTLTSNPPMPQNQIMALLTGQPTGQGAQGGVAQGSQLSTQGVFQSAQLAVLQPVLNQVGQGNGLTSVTVLPLYPNSYSVQLARALNPAQTLLLTLTQIYGSNLAGTQQELYGLEYKPKPSFIIQAATGALDEYQFFVQTIRRF